MLNAAWNRAGAGVGAVIAVAALAGLSQAEVITRVAVLTASQEVPTNASNGQGCARCIIDTDANTLTYRIVVTGLTTPETAAHFHGMAGPGVNAGVVHALPVGNVKTGVWNYAEAQEADILNGRTYINIHTAAFPGGEIRGQVVSAVALLDGGQEVPAVATPAQGVALFNINPVTNQLDYHIIYGGLVAAETAAHIHGLALPGTNAGVLHALPAANPKIGSWNYPEAQEQNILDGMMYVNIHTAFAPGGEIRGQIVSSVNPMDGQQENPPVASPAAGCGLCSFNRATNTMGFDERFANLVAAETAAHIHGFAPPTANAGVLFAQAAGSPKRGTWAFGAANLDNVFHLGRTYFNVHSAAFPGGEIRGQINRGKSIPCSPLVTDQPDNASAIPGGTASFSVVVDDRGGGTATYQWRKNGTNLANGGNISGALSATLNINPVGAGDAGDYDVIVTNFCGNRTSTIAELAVGSACDSVDFNGDGLFPDTADIDDFLSVFSGGPCSTGTCGDTDFNNDGLFPDTLDIDALLSVFSGGPCL
ncbi:MAG TPA: CHRD domain-containing protein [Phycisphaerales bacterium]|nr:CHRD domain-containing protein [Phycisphaerales bacterium]